MGGDQARLIAKSDHDLTVFDVFPGAREKFRDIARVADSVAEAVQDADLVQVCVRDAQQVNDVLFGEGDAVAHAKPGALILVHSTIDVAGVQAIADKVQQAGLRFGDAPVTRTAPSADGRFVLTMFGGDDEAFALAQPVLETFSTQALHVGKVGAAMALKIANNMMTWAQLVIGDLTFQLAQSHDISFEHLKTVTKANGNLTMVTELFLSGARANMAGLTPEQREFNVSQAGIGEKDLQLAIDAGAANGLDMRMIEIAQKLLRPAMTGA